jgi:molecular chaperone DnaK
MDYIAEQFQQQHGLDPRADENAAGKLWRECEDAKRALSARVRTAVALEYHGRPLRVEITRELFQELTRDLLDRTAFTTRQTLQAAHLRWEDLDRILLVGGSSRMPAVREMIKELTGKEPDCSISPDEAVAQGAAMHAGALLDKHAGRPAPFHIRNVNSHSLGVVATDVDTGRPRNAVVIPRNTPLPVTAKRVFKTHKQKQRSILVQVIEGESASPDHCSQIGRCTVRDLPPDLPARTPIEVLFHYRENGRLVVTVRVGGTHTKLQHEFVRQNSMTQQQLDSWRDYIHGLPMSAG